VKRLALVLSILLAVGAFVSIGQRAPSRAAATGPTPTGTEISFVVGLRMHTAELRRFVRNAADPRSLDFGKTLTSEQIGRRFGVPSRAEHHVLAVLRGHQVHIVATYPQRTEVDARATVGTLERYLHVAFRDHIGQNGRYRAPAHAPAVPDDLRPWVDGITGLSTKRMAVPHTIGPVGMRDVRRAYDVKPLYASGVLGAGAPIAVLGFADYSKHDVRGFDRYNHLPRALPIRVPNPAARRGDVFEPDLDVEVVHEIAPAARIYFYTAPKRGWSQLFNGFLRGPAKIGSLSWGFCDEDWPLGASDRRQLDKDLHSIAAAGKTLFVASGDQGAYDCQEDDFTDHSLRVDWPSDSADVVGVGGTMLGVARNGSYIGEDAWVEPLSNSGGGGGQSPVVPRPAWQDGLVQGSHRGVPDVAADASGGSPWKIFSGGGPERAWGTSAAAPFWAASMLLAEGYAKKHGVNARCFLAPLLYRVSAMQQPYRPAFHDVQHGTNRHYRAKPGWDYATGLGSPDVWNLTRDLVAYLRAHPAACRS